MSNNWHRLQVTLTNVSANVSPALNSQCLQVSVLHRSKLCMKQNYKEKTEHKKLEKVLESVTDSLVVTAVHDGNDSWKR